MVCLFLIARHLGYFKNVGKGSNIAFEDHNNPLILYSDVSETLRVAVEQEVINRNRKPLAFFFQKSFKFLRDLALRFIKN